MLTATARVVIIVETEMPAMPPNSHNEGRAPLLRAYLSIVRLGVIVGI